MPGIRAGASAAEADRLIDALVEANLIQEVAEERFRFHDLIRLHARRKADTDDTAADRDAALLAVLEWYLGGAGRADVAVTPYRRRLNYPYRTDPGSLPAFGDRVTALGWLEQERANLRAAGQAALDMRWAELAWHLSDVLWPLQLYRKAGDRREIDVRGLAAARMWGDPWAEGRMLKRLGRTLSTFGEHEAAEQHLRAAVERCAEAGDADGSVEAAEMLALSYRDAGRTGDAVGMLQDVLAARRERGRSRDVALTLINLGGLLSRLGDVPRAVELLREAGDLLGESADIDPYNPVRVAMGLAAAYLEAGDLTAADRAAAEAVAGMRALGTAIEEAEALELSGRIARRRGDLGRSRRCLQLALDLLLANGSPRAAGLRQRLAELPAPADPPGGQEVH
jgi:tetratricopeptide (TPR) repeat protein